MTQPVTDPSRIRYVLVALPDAAALIVLILLAVNFPAGPWWWILALIWTAVACRRGILEFRNHHT